MINGKYCHGLLNVFVTGNSLFWTRAEILMPAGEPDSPADRVPHRPDELAGGGPNGDIVAVCAMYQALKDSGVYDIEKRLLRIRSSGDQLRKCLQIVSTHVEDHILGIVGEHFRILPNPRTDAVNRDIAVLPEKIGPVALPPLVYVVDSPLARNRCGEKHSRR